MTGYFSSVADFLCETTDAIVRQLRALHPEAEDSQVRSWQVLINDVKQALNEVSLPADAEIVIEYSLPTDGMAADLLIAGKTEDGQKRLFIIESKQWDDAYISGARFSTYRQDGMDIHPEVQVSRHTISFRDYLNVGARYRITPIVFIRNASDAGIKELSEKHPCPGGARVVVRRSMKSILAGIGKLIVRGDPDCVKELVNAQFCPCKGIVDAMNSIVTREEPFILTPEQARAVDRIRDALKAGKKIVRVTGAAGAGKTAILLNLFVTVLKRSSKSHIVPIFVSGRQNTALYRSLYPASEDTFTLPWTLDRTVRPENGKNFMLFMDEAQHNDEGVVTNMVTRGARLVLCYDEHQTISANNPIAELKRLESREDFTTIELTESVRYNGSLVAEKNIRNCLDGGTEFSEDEKFEFKVFSQYEAFQDAIFSLITKKPELTVAVTSMLKTLPASSNQRLFTNWGSRTECEWMPYVRDRDYINQHNGKLWVGSWWMPGLDVDYTAVIIGEDAILTTDGLVADVDKVKMFAMIISIAQDLNVADRLIVHKPGKYGGVGGIDYYASYRNIITHLHKPENAHLRSLFTARCSEYIRNCYYIMMTRGKKGCFVYFDRRG